MNFKKMNKREYFKMQSLNLCYMDYILKESNSESVEMGTSTIRSLVIEDDCIFTIMQDGIKELGIDLDPDVSTTAIQEWIKKNPSKHEKIIAMMNGR